MSGKGGKRTLALSARRVLMGQSFCHTANELYRQRLTVREDQVPLRPSIRPQFIHQSFGPGDGRINPNVVLERSEVKKNSLFAKSGHAIADAPFCIGHPLLDDVLNFLQPSSRFGRD